MTKKKRVAVLYRVVQNWRMPVFERIAKEGDFEFKLFYGCDFPGTKVISAKPPFLFDAQKLFSIPMGVRSNRGNMLVPFSPFLFFHLIAYRPDVVVCEGASNFANNISVFVYCKIFRKKMIQWGLGEIRKRPMSRIRKILNPLIVPIEKRSDAVIAYSSIGAQYYKRIGVKQERIFTAVNVVDTERRQQEISDFHKQNKNISGKDRFKVVFIGALEKNKKIDQLAIAISDLYKQKYELSLHIIGDGSYASQLKSLILSLGIEEITFFHGKVSTPLIPYLHDADICVMPGLGGLAVSDALCHSVPVICGIGDGCEVDLINQMNGFQDDELNAEKISSYLSTLYNDREKLEKLKMNASKTIECHNIASYVNVILKAINKVL